MNVVDSSAWLEYFADGPNAEDFAAAIEHTESLVVPTVAVYEVYERVLQQRNEPAALQALGVMLQGHVVDLTTNLALSAARISVSHALPMADALILATATVYRATLWTQDADFEGFDGVEYRPARRRSRGDAAQRRIEP